MSFHVRDLIPTTPEHWRAVHTYLTEHQPAWRAALDGGRRRLVERLISTGYTPTSVLPPEGLGGGEVRVEARLKSTDRMLRTMRIDRISLEQVSDLYGYRIVVPGAKELEPVAGIVADLWEPAGRPSRYGWWQDWIRCDPGRSGRGGLASTDVVHLARQDAREVQVVTWRLYESFYLPARAGEVDDVGAGDRTPR